ncbi:MAG: hypothetical protein WCX82_02135 [archaeon]|jgi:uncharacterized membrane protein
MNIKKNVILGIVILVAFLLLVLSVYFYISAQDKIGRERIFDGNGPMTQQTPKFVALCDSNTDNATCEIQQQKTRETLDNEFKKSKRPFIFEYHKYLIPLAAFIGLLFGMIVFWAMSEKVNKTEKHLINNTELVLKMLPSTHRKLIQTLLENRGSVRQYELIQLTKLNKLKVHRILRDLEDDDIIKKEKIGKVNNIILNKEIYEILKEENK